jgi:predicted transcriptional regulator
MPDGSMADLRLPRGLVDRAAYDAVVAERDALLEELAAFKSDAAFEANESRRGPAAWGLTRIDAYIMRRLAARALVSRAVLEMSWPGGEDPHPKCVDAALTKLRCRLRRFGVKIENLRGAGWRLPADQRAMVRAALTEGAPLRIGPPLRPVNRAPYSDLAVACAVLAACAAGPATRKRLVRAAPGHTGRLSSLLERLERRGFLQARRSGREVWRAITPRGAKLLARLERLSARAAPRKARDG